MCQENKQGEGGNLCRFDTFLDGIQSQNHVTWTTECNFMELKKLLLTWLSPNGLFIHVDGIFSLDGFNCYTYSLCDIKMLFTFMPGHR